jgi:hypothetical protein
MRWRLAGGDGSQAIVAEVAAELELPYACIPAGTRNHFALDLGVDRDDVVGALDALVDGGERHVDLAEVNGRVFVNNVSLGVYAEAVQRPGYRGAKVRTLLDTVPDALGPTEGLISPGVAPPATSTTPASRYSSPTIATGSGDRSGRERAPGSTTDSSASPSCRLPLPSWGARSSTLGGNGPHRNSRSTPIARFRPGSTVRR